MTGALLALIVLLLFFIVLVLLVATSHIERIAIAIEAGNTAFGVDESQSDESSIAA